MKAMQIKALKSYCTSNFQFLNVCHLLQNQWIFLHTIWKLSAVVSPLCEVQQRSKVQDCFYGIWIKVVLIAQRIIWVNVDNKAYQVTKILKENLEKKLAPLQRWKTKDASISYRQNNDRPKKFFWHSISSSKRIAKSLSLPSAQTFTRKTLNISP